MAGVLDLSSIQRQIYKTGVATAVILGGGILIILGIVILLRQPLAKAAKTASEIAKIK
jgi:hypothetical protein